jgi:hypothetical protein
VLLSAHQLHALEFTTVAAFHMDELLVASFFVAFAGRTILALALVALALTQGVVGTGGFIAELFSGGSGVRTPPWHVLPDGDRCSQQWH